MFKRQKTPKRHSVIFILMLAFFSLNNSHKVFAQEQKNENNNLSITIKTA